MLALAEAIDAASAQFGDDQSTWPTNETVAMLLLDFADISANNAQHQLARDVTVAMRDGCVDSLRGALKLLVVHVRATRRFSVPLDYTNWLNEHLLTKYIGSFLLIWKVDFRTPKAASTQHRNSVNN